MNNFSIKIKRLIYGFQHQTKETIWKYMNNLVYDPTIYSTEVTEICPDLYKAYVFISDHNVVVVLLDTNDKENEVAPDERLKEVIELIRRRLENSGRNYCGSVFGMLLTERTVEDAKKPLDWEEKDFKIIDGIKNLKRHKIKVNDDSRLGQKDLVDDLTDPENDMTDEYPEQENEETAPSDTAEIEEFETVLKKFLEDNPKTGDSKADSADETEDTDTIEDEDEPDETEEDEDLDDVDIPNGEIMQNNNISVKVDILRPISNPRQELDKLVGCDDIKQRMDELVALTSYNKMMHELFPDSVQHNVSLHSLFLGKPGTGKTTVCKIFGSLLRQAGALSKGHVVVCDRSTFIGTLWGDEERSMNKVLQIAKGGVLMIDEAYLLSSKHESDPGKLVIQLLMNILADETQRDIAVVLCGYKEQMQRLLDINPGLESRFPNKFEFSDFTVDELLEITRRRVKEYEYEFTTQAWEKYRNVLTQAYEQRDPQTWGNARFIGNLLERIYIQHATRCMKERPADKWQMRQLTPEDICTIEVPRPKARIGF